MTIYVDAETCNRCSICSEVCPMAIIDSARGEKIPGIRDEMARKCISCGHCEAFCPTGALVQEPEVGEDDVRKCTIPGHFHPGATEGGYGGISPELLGIYLKSRRSVRQYRPEPVERETIQSILDIARYAASGGNLQPVEWLVLHDPQEVQKVADLTIGWMQELTKGNHPMSAYAPYLVNVYKSGRDVICRGAPHLLIPHIPEDNQIAPADAIIALTHMDIAAPSFGIGTCWAGFVAMASKSHKPLLDYYALPEGRIPAYAMLFGYPRYLPKHIPGRKPLKITWK